MENQIIKDVNDVMSFKTYNQNFHQTCILVFTTLEHIKEFRSRLNDEDEEMHMIADSIQYDLESSS